MWLTETVVWKSYDGYGRLSQNSTISRQQLYSSVSLSAKLPQLSSIWEQEFYCDFDVAEEETEDVPNIPGLDWNQDSPFFKQIAAERMPVKKIPFARPIPRSFEKAWLGQEPPQTAMEKGIVDFFFLNEKKTGPCNNQLQTLLEYLLS